MKGKYGRKAVFFNYIILAVSPVPKAPVPFAYIGAYSPSPLGGASLGCARFACAILRRLWCARVLRGLFSGVFVVRAINRCPGITLASRELFSGAFVVCALSAVSQEHFELSHAPTSSHTRMSGLCWALL
ncbi:hypothetical protein Ddc_23730 [Ditylenchus destructor]|nr:hypothetical protein Ddc_23730 [Ditylenchus destructor]